MTPTNRLNHRTLESDLVYPRDKGYIYIAKLDEKWVKQKLRTLGAEDINNKYCISIESNNGHILITNHDGTYWLTELPVEEPDFDWEAEVARGR